MPSEQAKYQQIVEWVQEQVRDGALSYGEKLPPESAISTRFGVSRQTVRRAFNVLAQEGYLESRQGSGSFIVYRDPGPKKSSRIIGVITTYADTYIFPSILKGIESVLTSQGYTMWLALTHNQTDQERRALLSMSAKNVDGLILEPAKSGLPTPNEGLYQKLIDEKLPLLFINGYFPQLTAPHVSMDDRRAGYLATSFLVKAGHRKIAGIFKMDDYQGRLRYAGYLDALLEMGIEPEDSQVMWYTTEDAGELESRGAVAKLTGCTAVVCYNDELAVQLIAVLERHGVTVPEGISLTSIDNSGLAPVCRTPLTSVAHPMEKLGETAAEQVLKMIGGSEFQATVEFQPELVVRNSVKKLTP